MYQPPEGYAHEALQAKSNGFHAYKFRPALGPQEDVRLVEVLREAVGDNFELFADVAAWHSRLGPLAYSFATVRHIAQQYDDLGVYLMEEPFPAQDPHLYRDLRSCVDLPIAGGESLATLEECERWLWAEAVDILQSSPDHLGGITGCRRLLEVLKDEQVPLVPHNWATTLNALAIAHLLATVPEEAAPWMEFPMYTNDRWEGMYPFPLGEGILELSLSFDEGKMVLPSGPGLGVHLDHGLFEKNPYIPGRPN
jgi:L-alanine-DL-glutamate epimerase-like enolase superfamily enzyme